MSGRIIDVMVVIVVLAGAPLTVASLDEPSHSMLTYHPSDLRTSFSILNSDYSKEDNNGI